jgi:hypothetical protein
VGPDRKRLRRVHGKGLASHAGVGRRSVQSWAGAEKMAHGPFLIFKFLFHLNKSIGDNKNMRNA